MRTRTTSFLVFLLVIMVSLPTIASSDDEHDFPVGMYSVASTQSELVSTFDDTLEVILDGTGNSYEACNMLQSYRNLIVRPKSSSVCSQASLEFYENLLDEIYEAAPSDTRPKLLVSINYVHVAYCIDDSDTLQITTGEYDSLDTYLSELLEHDHANLIAGYYIADEPYANDIDADDLQDLRDAIYQIDPSRKFYVAEQVIDAISDPGYTYDEYEDSFDVLMIEWYDYVINDTGATLEGWNESLIKAREEIDASKELHTIVKASVPGGDETSTCYVTHGMTHAAIRHVMKLGVDGIWLYAWNTPSSVTYGAKGAQRAWTLEEELAEAFETELHDVDHLITAFSDSIPNGSRVTSIYRANEGADLVGPKDNYLYSNYESSVGYVKSLAAADLRGLGGHVGQTGVDFNLIDDTNDTYKRTAADGDDELITAFSESQDSSMRLFYSVDGSVPRDSTCYNYNYTINAMARGDFDGDGDGEIAVAFETSYWSYIYILDATGSGVQWRSGIRSNDCSINSLAACDWAHAGKDALVWSYTKNGTNYIRYGYIDSYQSGTGSDYETYGNSLLITSSWEVTAMTAGDFHVGGSPDTLLVAFYNDTTENSIICHSNNDSSGFSLSLADSVYSSDYYRVECLEVGRFWDYTDSRGGRDWLVSAVSNEWHTESALYVGDYGNGYIHGNGNISQYGARIWYNTSGGFVTAVTAGSFRESDDSQTAKIAQTYLSNDEQGTSDSPGEFELSISSYPNPFNPSATLTYMLPDAGKVKLTVYTATGQKVATLVDTFMDAGSHSAVFNGAGYASGIYIYQLETPSGFRTGRMMMVK